MAPEADWPERSPTTTSDAPVGALDGLHILDLSDIGAFASMLLTDFGADTIRVTAVPGIRPRMTSGSRFMPGGDADPARSAAFNAFHRGQRSIALNLKDADASAILKTLARTADVVLESFRPGVVERLGADYATLSEANPRLVYCSLSGFGQTGPYRDLPGHDINYIAQGGLLGVTRRAGAPPTIPINFGADFAGGALYAAFSILVALEARERTGRGQYIDMAMSDGVLSLLTGAFRGYFADGEEIVPQQYFLNGGVPWYDTYECADGRRLSVGAIEGHFYAGLCHALGLPEWLDHQFDEDRHEAMRASFAQAVAQRSADEWMQIMPGYDVPAVPVLELREIPEDAQVRAREMVVELDSPVGTVRQIGVAPQLSDTPGNPRATGPATGEHTGQILAQLGYSAEEVEALSERRAIA